MNKWESYFAEMTDDELKSAWWTWGRDSEDRDDIDVWAAVNYEMQSRNM